MPCGHEGQLKNARFCSGDVESEMARFEQALEARTQEYSYLAPEPTTVLMQVQVAIDMIATCCFGAFFQS